MIPLRLKITNFMSYGEEPTLLDFSGLHVACLAGENGGGKSAILEAMTWALWGKTRAKQESELIHHGQSRMEVVLDFALEGTEYRVRRQRDLRGRGQSTLEFQIRDNGGYRNLSEASIPQTQEKIDHTLHLDYETFINSAFLMQGRADEFTKKTPAQRKEILGEILGLAQYNLYEARAKEKAKQKEGEVARLEAALGQIASQVAKKPELEQEAVAAAAEVKQQRERLLAEEERLHRLRQAQQELKSLEEQRETLANRVQEADNEILRLQTEVEGLDAEIQHLQSILAAEPSIREGFATLQAAQSDNDRLNQLLARHLQLEKEKHSREQAVARAQAQLQAEVGLRQERCQQLSIRIQSKPQLEAGLASLHQEMATLDSAKQEMASLQTAAGQAEKEIAGLEAHNQNLMAEIQLLREKANLLAATAAHCPVCEQELSQERRDKIRNQYLAQCLDNEQRVASNGQRIAEIRNKIASYQEDKTRLAKVEQREAEFLRQAGSLSQELRQVQEAEVRYQEEAVALQTFQDRLRRRDFAHQEQDEFQKIEEIIHSLAYDPPAHEELRQQLKVLRDFEEKYRELERAQDLISQRQGGIANRQKRLSEWQEKRALEISRQKQLQEQQASLLEILKDLPAQEKAINDLRSNLEEAQKALGGIQSQLATLAELETEKRVEEENLKKAAAEQGIYAELAQAFGKRGMQAMLIESAIPEIEVEANRMLTRMSDGRMHLRLETQRETQKGDILETLEIKLSDERGSRSYELYSGGEAFRADFTIRIALSKLLSRRAGARLQTLIIDEGFGTQDAQGRERLLETIRSVQGEFACILVITHLEELKEFFPVQITVHKTQRGSQIAMG